MPYTRELYIYIPIEEPPERHLPQNSINDAVFPRKRHCDFPSFLLSNVRSLLPKLEDLEVVLKSNNIDLAFITETWLTDQIGDSASEINGYSLVRRERTSGVGGGVCTFIRINIPFRILDHLHDSSFETLWLYLRPCRLPRSITCIIICVMYHPPSNDDKTMVQHLSTMLDLALTQYPHAGLLIVGDFNRCPISALRRRFDLKQIVKHPTRGDAILDLILTNMSGHYLIPQIIPPIGSSDHNSVLCIPTNRCLKNESSKIKIRESNTASKNALGRWLANINWNNLYHSASCDQKLEILQTTLETGLDIFLPSKVVKLHNCDKPWITPKFKKIVQDRQKAFHQRNMPLYNRFRNLAIREGRKLKASFLKRKLEQLKINPNPKRWWSSIKGLA